MSRAVLPHALGLALTALLLSGCGGGEGATCQNVGGENPNSDCSGALRCCTSDRTTGSFGSCQMTCPGSTPDDAGPLPDDGPLPDAGPGEPDQGPDEPDQGADDPDLGPADAGVDQGTS